MNPITADIQAKTLLDWLQGRADERGEVSFRDALQSGPGPLRTKAALEAALKTLADHGRIGEASTRPRRIRVGRTVSADYGVTPATVATVGSSEAPTLATLAGGECENADAPHHAPGPSTPAAVAKVGEASWREALLALSPGRDPCPGFRPGAWARVHANALDFVEKHGDKAAALGWTAEELFGVHPASGVVRPDCCGALMLSRGVRVVQVRPDQICFANRFAFRRNGKSRSTIPVWKFG